MNMMKSTQRLLFALGAGLATFAIGDPGKCGTPHEPSEPVKPSPASTDANAPAAEQEAVSGVPAAGTAVRVGGDMQAQVSRVEEKFFRSGACFINTELPAGYPAPTPPGAIEIKSYPSVRRAEVSGTLAPDIGMNIAFFPLFSHIKRRDIAMTSPVEVDFKGINFTPPEGGDVKAEAWTMSFLYRTPELGPAGKDEGNKKIDVVDTPPLTVVSMGRKGPYRFQDARKVMEQLSAWLADNPKWEKAGDPRVLHYNGPDVRDADLWSEVQWVIRPAAKIERPATPSSLPNIPSGTPAGTDTPR